MQNLYNSNYSNKRINVSDFVNSLDISSNVSSVEASPYTDQLTENEEFLDLDSSPDSNYLHQFGNRTSIISSRVPPSTHGTSDQVRNRVSASPFVIRSRIGSDTPRFNTTRHKATTSGNGACNRRDFRTKSCSQPNEEFTVPSGYATPIERGLRVRSNSEMNTPVISNEHVVTLITDFRNEVIKHISSLEEKCQNTISLAMDQVQHASASLVTDDPASQPSSKQQRKARGKVPISRLKLCESARKIYASGAFNFEYRVDQSYLSKHNREVSEELLKGIKHTTAKNSSNGQIVYPYSDQEIQSAVKNIYQHRRKIHKLDENHDGDQLKRKLNTRKRRRQRRERLLARRMQKMNDEEKKEYASLHQVLMSDDESRDGLPQFLVSLPSFRSDKLTDLLHDVDSRPENYTAFPRRLTRLYRSRDDSNYFSDREHMGMLTGMKTDWFNI